MEARSSAPTKSLRHGAALVMTLITLSILILLLVGFLSTMLTERRAAAAFEDTQRAKLIGAGAVSHAIDLLRTNIPEPARLSEGAKNAPGENWVVNPGRLTVIKDGAAPLYIPLHTGEVTVAPDPKLPRDADSADLNQPLPGQTTPVITGTPDVAGAPRPPMRVKWVNLLRDPSGPAAADNKLAGRYAFWIDDECARLNINTAVGKPAPGQDGDFDAQLKAGFLTPLFAAGTSQILSSATSSAFGSVPRWALGRPQSVNLDVLFDDPKQLRRDQLVDQVFVQGYSRYPEAILNFVTLQGTEARAWFDRSKYFLTAYSRAPEFNAFGRSRLFTTYVPLSLEGGPSYQQPFLYDPTGMYDGVSGNEVLHLDSLLGTFGFTSTVQDEDGATVNGGNVVNRAQVQMLWEYLHRRWPGYSRSFAERYGEREAFQLAINAALMARVATTQISNASLLAFTNAYAARTTSVNYSPASNEMVGLTPERMYWRPSELKPSIPGFTKRDIFLPQTPGPHIMEIRLFAKSTDATPPPKNDKTQLTGYARPRYVQFWYEVEYYMHPFAPIVDLSVFPTRMDYFEIGIPGYAGFKTQQFGPATAPDPANPTATVFDADWTTPKSLGRLIVQPTAGSALGPTGSGTKNRLTFTSKIFTVGQTPQKLAFVDDSVTPLSYTDWDPFVFDAAKAPSVTVNFRLRPGMSVAGAAGRPRQMIPLGETRDDTLKASFTVSLVETRDQAVSWQINDPRLSNDLTQWGKTGAFPDATGVVPGLPNEGPGTPSAAGASDGVGTPALQNRNEPGEDSAEKSKYRYLQRALTGGKVAGYDIDRPDEYDPRSRVSSPGYWSLLHTGMQSGRPWRTLDFGPAANQQDPPDWLLLDLFGATYPMANDQWRLDQRQPDCFSTASYMNSTAGQLNLNSRIYPRTDYFQPPERTKPLQAVFQNLPGIDAKQAAQQIAAYQTDTQIFDYVSELANISAISGAGSTAWQREFALRNMAGVLTTKSNTFGVWGVAQVLKKLPKNTTYDRFEKGDEVVAEKRFYALVERYIWPGRDGVPGNGHAASAGRWDRLAQQTSPISTASGVTNTLFQLPGSPPLFRSGALLTLDTAGAYAEFDGPERVAMNSTTAVALGHVTYRESTLEEAYNPPQALIKYRVVSFKYLDQ